LFDASTGFFLRGKVTPPVEGVKIDLVDSKSRLSRQTVYTNELGSYKVFIFCAFVYIQNWSDAFHYMKKFRLKGGWSLCQLAVPLNNKLIYLKAQGAKFIAGL